MGGTPNWKEQVVPLAQPAERGPYKPEDPGSNPGPPICARRGKGYRARKRAVNTFDCKIQIAERDKNEFERYLQEEWIKDRRVNELDMFTF